MVTATVDTHACCKLLSDSGSTPAQTATKADIDLSREAMMRAVSDLKAHIVWWLLVFSIGQVGATVGLLKALH